jgi:hypothetical protein
MWNYDSGAPLLIACRERCLSSQLAQIACHLSAVLGARYVRRPWLGNPATCKACWVICRLQIRREGGRLEPPWTNEPQTWKPHNISLPRCLSVMILLLFLSVLAEHAVRICSFTHWIMIRPSDPL